MKYKIKPTTIFKKQVRLMSRRGCDLNLLIETVDMLALGIQLPEKYHDHPLSGKWKGYRECHIRPDWLLIYKADA